ncbi:GNAT family N-acetyltransferase [Pseudooceanicola sp. 216_PA32_1]|uniref:L-ornithine N(alpha)-acyltransferase n=2 Tax=Pseudooceanicola pacificus TaxID=2676438 RepID=A0A844WBR6_9RHOB|nr:GNAT family N-acetyltransferase [Pseudooceanicola pacificus]
MQPKAKPQAAPAFTVRLARDGADLEGAQRLRYRVFVEELGSDGPMVDHAARLERDRFDAHFDHLILIDEDSDAPDARDRVVGVYRLLPSDRLAEVGQFYSESEYDLSVLKASGRRLLELGRSCLLPDYRGGMAMWHLWNALSAYVAERGIEVLFGVASFHGTEVERLAGPLSLLHHRHLAPPDLRVRAQPDHFQRMDLVAEEALDRRAAMLAVPALIKAYLRLGGFVGEGAYVDHDFNTVDVCLVLDTARMNETQRAIYSRGLNG